MAEGWTSSDRGPTLCSGEISVELSDDLLDELDELLVGFVEDVNQRMEAAGHSAYVVVDLDLVPRVFESAAADEERR